MPSASGAVLQRTKVAMQASGGLFGLGGSTWREGATLVLTLHGYLHMFFLEASSKAPKASGPAGRPVTAEDEELVESAIKASVYVPLATRCVFLRKGKELTLDLAEAEAAEAPPPSKPGPLSRWMGRGGDAQPLPRRVQARVADAQVFQELEQRCHDFVRRGQGLRNAAASAAAAAAATAAAGTGQAAGRPE
uniref:Uncharacterized protein n=2 Tax=Alexandrium monilatum TaxID=311494 RepID=A0A7S4SSQ9_9DINO